MASSGFSVNATPQHVRTYEKDVTAAMASHRKPRQGTLSRTTARTAATLALAGAASATALDSTVHAEPRLTPAQVKAKVDRLHQEAEEAIDSYNGAKEHTERARKAVEDLQDEAARKTARLNASRDALGSTATAQYRSGSVDPALQLLLSSSPEQYLDHASLLDRAGSRQAAAVTGIGRRLRALDQLRGRAGEKLAELRDDQAELRRHKRVVRDRLAAAQRLLDQLPPAERTALLGEDQLGSSAALSGMPQAPNPRAARAVAFAFGALGKPYVWGATGPAAYDCSGLTQAAWKAAGVSLPRTTYTQIAAGRRIPRSELAPGDLVFFYSGVSHVGLYIGAGRMIHAPHPGAPVRIAPIDQMPFAGATRPA